MKTFHTIPQSVLMVGLVSALLGGFAMETVHAQPATGACSNAAGALSLFDSRVENYAALHRRLAALLPPMATRPDVQSTRISRKALATALRASRRDAHTGDILGGPVEVAFRCLVATAERNSEGWLSGLAVDSASPPEMRPFVNESYPPDLLREVPYFLQLVLPPVPEEVEYVVIDDHLVLWDIYAEVVVDVLPNAFGNPFYGTR